VAKNFVTPGGLGLTRTGPVVTIGAMKAPGSNIKVRDEVHGFLIDHLN